MKQILYIGLAGFAGALARYGIAGLCQRLPGAESRPFPYGTLIVNLLGCFLLGVLNAVFEERALVTQEVRLALTIGFLGSFTTFSTFGYETFRLMNTGDWARASANVLISVIAGILAVWLGYRLGQVKL